MSDIALVIVVAALTFASGFCFGADWMDGIWDRALRPFEAGEPREGSPSYRIMRRMR